jgi:hypothetical protein
MNGSAINAPLYRALIYIDFDARLAAELFSFCTISSLQLFNI